MTSNRSFFDHLVQELLRSKQANYSEECISYYLDQTKFIIEDLPKLYNNRNERLKCTLIRHRGQDKNSNKEEKIDHKCIVYLHGLGSSRLQALNIAQHIPKNYSICMFDMSGSGKSQGDFVTYGLKEHQDIQPVISYLNRKKYVKQFVIWGRSMGAVATLLYAIENYQSAVYRERKSIFCDGQSLRNSMANSKSVAYLNENSMVKAIVLDSPFHNFRDIAKQIATKKMSIPHFILDIALNYVQESFSKILKESIGQKYNPFRIAFNNQIKLKIPILFIYSQKDEIIPANQCQLIINNIRSKFQKIPINECTHNQARPQQIIIEIFAKLQKFNRIQSYQDKKLNQSISKDMTISYSCQKKRGIFVYTPSKQKDSKQTIDEDKRSICRMRDTIDIEMIRTENQIQKSPRSRTSLVRRNPIGLRASRKSRDLQQKKFETISTDQFLSNLNTIDTQTNNLINQKLKDIRDTDNCIAKVGRTKRFNFDKRKEVKLTHQRYLE